MAQTRFIMPSWDEVCSLVCDLSERVHKEFTPDVIVGISRGGLIPSRLLADLLGVSTLLTVGVAFYKDIARRENQPRITQALPSHITGQHLLVVDDVADTGKSLELIVGELKKVQHDIRTATLYRKPWVQFKPDFYAKETDSWIIFPWERMETLRKIVGGAPSSSKNSKEVEDQLVSAGIERSVAQNLVREVKEGLKP